MKKRFILYLIPFVLLLVGPINANRAIFRNRTVPPHFLESSVSPPQVRTITSSQVWLIPPGVEYAIVIAVAGGGGGGNGAGGDTDGGSGGGGGGVTIKRVDLRGMSSAQVSVLVGYGGSAGVKGDDTRFGVPILLEANGGAAGSTSGGVQIANNPGGGDGGTAASGAGVAGEVGFMGTGGAAGGIGGGGGGGGGSFGNGSAGAAALSSAVDAAPESGGGGGGGGDTGGTGGRGGSGKVIIFPILNSTTELPTAP